jgi:hypothetical protein
LYAAIEAAASPLRAGPLDLEDTFGDGAAAAEVPPEGMDSQAQLSAALQVLDTVHRFAAARTAAQLPAAMAAAGEEGGEAVVTPGQRLARFLREQLVQREEERLQAERSAAAARQALASRDAELAASRGECAELEARVRQADAALQRARAQAAASDAVNEELRGRLQAAQALAQQEARGAAQAKEEADAARAAAAAQSRASEERAVELEARLQAATAAAAAAPGADASWPSPEFHSPEQQQRPRVGHEADGEVALPATPLSDVFASPPGARPAEPDAAGAASDADTDDTISEAAEAVRCGARTAALRAQREQAAALRGAPRTGALADRFKQHAAEERHLRSEIDTLERKVREGACRLEQCF